MQVFNRGVSAGDVVQFLSEGVWLDKDILPRYQVTNATRMVSQDNNRYRIMRGSQVIYDPGLTKQDLTASLMNGAQIEVKGILGVITAISIESGYSGRTNHFNVTIWDGTSHHTFYVHTRD